MPRAAVTLPAFCERVDLDQRLGMISGSRPEAGIPVFTRRSAQPPCWWAIRTMRCLAETKVFWRIPLMGFAAMLAEQKFRRAPLCS
jgi:hypothetical protein